MPTGYTADVQSGKVTDFPTFAMMCARAFGALVMMRDSGMDAAIPERFEPSDYHVKALAREEAELAALRAMGPDEIRAACEAEVEEAINKRTQYRERQVKHRQRYEAMLAQAKAWEPPTSEHVGLKEFMVEQLTGSIDHDCGGSWEPPIPTDDPDEWLRKREESLERSIARHREEHKKEVERTESRNRWLDDLRASLKEAA